MYPSFNQRGRLARIIILATAFQFCFSTPGQCFDFDFEFLFERSEIAISIGTIDAPASIPPQGISLMIPANEYQFDTNSSVTIGESHPETNISGWLFQAGNPQLDVLVTLFLDSMIIHISPTGTDTLSGSGFALLLQGILITIEDDPVRRADPSLSEVPFLQDRMYRIGHLPDRGKFMLKNPDNIIVQSLAIRNLSGKLVHQESIWSSKPLMIFDFDFLLSGVYVLECIDEEQSCSYLINIR